MSLISPGSTLSNSLFMFPLLITKITLILGLLYNPINPIFSICLSLQFSTIAVLFSLFPLQSFSSSPSLYFCHSVMPPFLSLHHAAVLSLYHTTLVHFFAGTLLRRSLSFFFFLVLCLLLCLVLGVWVVRKCGKANGFFGFVNFFFFVCFLRK